VRDAAVGVVAKYLGSQDTIPIALYETVSGRILVKHSFTIHPDNILNTLFLGYLFECSKETRSSAKRTLQQIQ
jgi:hypothetical protein